MRSLFAAWLLLIAVPAVPAAAAPPVLTFEAKAVTATGITPNG